MEGLETIQDGYSNNTNETPQQSITEILKSQFAEGSKTKLGDVFTNAPLDLGFGTDDPTVQSIYPQARTLTWNLQRIEAVMRADPFFVRALEYRSSTPFTKGIDIRSENMGADKINEFKDKVEEKIDIPLKEAFFEADAFGWSGLVIMIDGQMNKQDLKRPLRKKDIQKGKFMGLKPLTRWYQINPAHKMINQIGERNEIYDPRLLGTPLYYKVSFDGDKGNVYEIHRSRLLIISRNRLSYIEKKVEHYGGTSILEQAFESLSRYHSLVAQIHRIINKAIIPVLKLEGLTSNSLQTEKGIEMVEKKIDQMRRQLNNNSLFVISDEDDLSFAQAQLQELANLLREARIQVASAFNTPPQVLFYEEDKYSPADFNGFIKERQKFHVKPSYRKLLPILYKSEYGEDIPDYDIDFKPLENLTTEEIAKARKTNVEAIDILYGSGIINKKTAMDTLSDIDSNPTDIFRNLDPEYIKYVESLGAEEGHHTEQIRLAKALNQEGDGGYERRGEEGKEKGGNPEKTKKPTPKVPVKSNKEKEG